MLNYSVRRVALRASNASHSIIRLGAAELSTKASTSSSSSATTSKPVDAGVDASAPAPVPASASFTFQSSIKSPFLSGTAEEKPKNTSDKRLVSRRGPLIADVKELEFATKRRAPFHATNGDVWSEESKKHAAVVKMRVATRRETARGVPRFSALVQLLGEKNSTSLVCAVCTTVLVDDTSIFRVSEGGRGVHVRSSDPTVFNQIALGEPDKERDWTETRAAGQFTRVAKGVCPVCSSNFASVTHGVNGEKEMLIKKVAVQVLRKSDGTMSTTKLQWKALQQSKSADELMDAFRFVSHDPTHSRVVLHNQLLSPMTSVDQIMSIFTESPEIARDPWNVVVTLNQCVSLLPIIRDEVDGDNYVDTSGLLTHPEWNQLEQAVTDIVSKVVPMVSSSTFTNTSAGRGIKKSPRSRPLSHLPADDIASFSVAVAQTHSKHNVREMTVRYVREELDIAEGFGAEVNRNMLVLAEEMVAEQKPEGWAITRWFSGLIR